MPRGQKDTDKVNRARQVERLRRKGKSVPETAKALGMTTRRVSQLRAYARSLKDLDPHRLDDGWLELPALEGRELMATRSVEGFEAFWLAYSGYTYLPAHLRQAVVNSLADQFSMTNIPPGFAKSEVFSVWLPIWLICLDPDEQIILISKTDTVAKKMSNKIAYQLTSNEKLIADWGPFIRDEPGWPWRPNSGELMVARRRREFVTGDLTLQVRGRGQQIVGLRATRIVGDDPTDRETAESEAENRKAWAWITGDVMTRLVPGGTATIIGQRVHMQDMYGKLAKLTHLDGKHKGEPIFKVHTMPAVNERGESLWPEQWPIEELGVRRSILGVALFNTMYQQAPEATMGAFVVPGWIHGSTEQGWTGCLDLDRDVGQGFRPDGEGEESFLPLARVISVDPSPTRYAGMVVADVAQLDMPIIGVIELTSKKQTARELKYDVDERLDRYAPVDYVIFEDSAVSTFLLQDPWVDALRARTTVLSHRTHAKSKGDPIMGTSAMAADFEHGRIRLPYASPEAKAMVEDFLTNEVYPWPEGQVDDRLMALWFIKYAWRSLRPKNQMPGRFRGQSRQSRIEHGWGDFAHVPERPSAWTST